MNKYFIITSNANLAQKLKKDGYTLLNTEGTKYIFINSGTRVFSEEEKLGTVFTDRLNFAGGDNI